MKNYLLFVVLVLAKNLNAQALPDTLLLKNDSLIVCRLNKVTKDLVYYAVPDKDGNNNYFRRDRQEVVAIIDHNPPDQKPLSKEEPTPNVVNRTPIIGLIAAGAVVQIAVIIATIKGLGSLDLGLSLGGG